MNRNYCDEPLDGTSQSLRQWIDFAVAGQFMFGNAPQEIRTWIVDQQPVAWSFHYMHVIPSPAGFLHQPTTCA